MQKTYLITGVAGFVGSNYAKYLLKKGEKVIGLDNLSRYGAKENLDAICKTEGIENFDFIQFDLIKDNLDEALREYKIDRVVHLAAQTAVTKSVEDPIDDMKNNIFGTLNLLEYLRKYQKDASLIFNSTNKVYGEMREKKVILNKETDRYDYENKLTVKENTNLDGHSPYGVSKLACDQYVRDYHRIYGLKTVVFRCSCIYGEMQMGCSDQGWLSWFTIATQTNSLITIYGDGKQIRDVLYIDDLLNAYELAFANIDKCQGEIYNMGGGYNNVISLLELVKFLEFKKGEKLNISFDNWRPGDQKCFIADTSKFESVTGWQATTKLTHGLNNLWNWVRDNINLFKK